MTFPSDITVLKKGKSLNAWKNQNTPDTCVLCGRKMSEFLAKNRVVDHDHKTGEVRGVICRNCNGLLGKVENLCCRAGNFVPDVIWLKNIIQYWAWSHVKPTGVYYPGTTWVAGKTVAPKVKRRKRSTSSN